MHNRYDTGKVYKRRHMMYGDGAAGQISQGAGSQSMQNLLQHNREVEENYGPAG
jgi:predicted NUDIX family phosphoesterase